LSAARNAAGGDQSFQIALRWPTAIHMTPRATPCTGSTWPTTNLADEHAGRCVEYARL
jgi:hypothetical protein